MLLTGIKVVHNLITMLLPQPNYLNFGLQNWHTKDVLKFY